MFFLRFQPGKGLPFFIVNRGHVIGYFMHGNNCGHIPDTPRWFAPPPQHNRPKIISKIIGAIRLFYRDPTSTIPSLNLANGSNRQQRSERREACISVLGCLLHYLDLVTLRVGIPQADASFQGISMPFIAEKSGLTLKRTERAVRDLVKSGLITVHPLCEKINDTLYKGYAAIRTISAKLFTLFGLSGRLRYERERATERQKKRTRKQERKAKAKIDLLIAGAGAGNQTKHTRSQESTPQTTQSTRINELRSIKAILNSP
jgi:hypothetical protein